MSENDPILANNKGKRFRLWTDFGTFFEETLRPIVAEFVGTMFFVFIGTMSVAGAGGMLGVATAHGLIITIVVAALANISGGHVNPAVTLALCLTGVINPLNAVLYVVSQLAGSITGAALTRGILSKATYVSIAGGATMLGPDTTVAEGFLAEIVLTSILILTILLTAVDNSTKTGLAPIAIGFAVIVNILAGASISGASMNPARSLGPAVAVTTYTSSVWDDHWLYWVGPGLGALLAVLLHRLFLAGPEKRFLQV